MTVTVRAAETGEKIVIPYESKAGQEAFEIFYRIAKRLHSEAKAETDRYIADTYPGSKTIRTEHADGGYQRTVITPEWEEILVRYDYRTKTIGEA